MRVLLATDGSERARRAEEAIVAFPARSELDVTAITVVKVPQPPLTSIGPAARRAYGAAIAAFRREERQRAETVLQRTRASLSGHVRTLTTRIEEGLAAPAIIEAAEVWNADLVVLGSRGLGPVKEFLLGSVCQKVVRYAPCSVLVVKRPVDNVRRALVAVDGSIHAEAGLKFLTDLQLPQDAVVHLCAVAELPAFPPPNAGWSREARADVLRTIAEIEMAAADRLLAVARTLLATKGWTVTTSLRTGHAAEQILAAIREWSPDLVVIGAKGRTAPKRFVLGGVAQKIFKYAPCSVLVVRP